MNSSLTNEFLACFAGLPEHIKSQARRNYRLWKANPSHPSLEFKLVGKRMPIYSVRVGIGWRALGLRDEEGMVWFWIGSHAEYDKLVRKL